MKKFSSVFFVFFVLLVGLSAQDGPSWDDTRDETLFGSSGLRLTGAWGGPTYGSTFFFNGNGTQTRGGFGGLEFNKVLFVGIGSEWTDEELKEGPSTDRSFKLRRQGVIFDFTPLSQKVIHPRINFWMGNGEVEVENEKDKLFVVQPGVGFEVNVFRWWKVGLEGGYRFVSRTDVEWLDNEDLSSAFVNVRLRFGYSWGN
jgi:hypothetical protein